MAIKLADTARPNNYVDAEHLGTYPVAYAEDVWFEDGTRLSEKTFDGESIQVTELPLGGSALEGKIYQYIGTTGTYQNGCFYQCQYSEYSGWIWKPIPVVEKGVTYRESYSFAEFPIGTVIIYSGNPEYGMKLGHHYKYDSNKPLKLYRFTGVKDGENVHYYLTTDKCEIGDAVFFYNSNTMYTYVKFVNGSTVTFGNDVVVTDFTYANETETITYTGWFDIGGGGSGDGGTLYADNPIGSIVPYGSTTAPTGWLLCQGQAISRTEYADLFNAIGTSFGAGDGSTTFNLPDLREATTKGTGLSGKSSNHYDSNGVALGEFVEDRIQSHLHSAFTGNRNGWIQFFDPVPNGSPARTQAFDVDNAFSVGEVANARNGNTTEVKAVGVNYIIKAKHTPVPADFMDAVGDAVDEALTPTTEISVTFPQTAINAFPEIATRFHVRRCGSLVQVNVDNLAISDRNLITDYLTLVEGLPKPFEVVNFAFIGFPEETDNYSTVTAGYIGINGELVLRYTGNISQNAGYLQGFQCMYFTRD